MTERKRLLETNSVKRPGTISRFIFGLCFCFLLGLPLVPSNSLVFAEDYMLYLPSQVDTGVAPLPGNGVLAKSIIIKKGDTLSALSRKFSGKASYFPQILLFNEIRNPNLIYAGQKLIVPLPATHALPALRRPPKAMTVNRSASTIDNDSQKVLTINHHEVSVKSAEQKLYEQSVALFAEGKYLEALEGFNRFLTKYPASDLAPEASLYRGDCFLHLSEI